MPRTTSWTCDTCGQAILKIEDGWVEWLTVPDLNGGASTGRKLRLVHSRSASPLANGCQIDEAFERKQDGAMLKDLPLENFVGADGLMSLLAMLAEGELPKDDLLELTKRIHVDGYEIARNYLDEAEADGVYEPNTWPGYPFQSQIEAVLQHVARKRP